ncbi:MAG TPA: phage tail protein [Streptosporangiaceae bacterium]
MDTARVGKAPVDLVPPASGYLDYLPALFRADPFAGRFLLAFEAVLSGLNDQQGLETVIGRIADFFDPATTEPDFLPWLAGWVALSLRADWDDRMRRDFIGQIVPLYRLRGTRAGLLRVLTLYTGEQVQVFDAFDKPPYFFEVQLTLSEPDPKLLRAKQQIARAIIDQEKPAHTFYALRVVVPTMRLVSEELHERTGAPLLILGKNTVLGTDPADEEEQADGRLSTPRIHQQTGPVFRRPVPERQGLHRRAELSARPRAQD